MNNIIVDVGTPPDGISEGWTTTVVRFHGFTDLTTIRSECVSSPEFSCFGHQWRLNLFPGGDEVSDEGYVSVALGNRSNSSIKIQWGCSVRDTNYKEVMHHEPDTFEFAAIDVGNNAWFKNNFAQRSTLVELVVQGSLVIEVLMKPTTTDKSITQFIPTNPIYKNVLQKFMDEETADVVFEISKETFQNEDNVNKKSFHAHRFILQDVSTMLAELCKPAEGGISTISITDVKPEIFKHMIYYAYGGKLSEEDLKANAKDIINACDKYGVVHLKLEAEACYKSNEITMDNIMDNLLFADSKNLALLKETVMDYIIKSKHSIMGKVSFNEFPGHLVTDLLAAVARGHPSENENDNEDKESIKYNEMRVGTLRKMLDEKGLDVDGSRESMIALLKENDA